MQPLSPAETRVLGALIEKEATTPEYYPLSLNALITACNQKSNRHPVVDYDEATVTEAIRLLREKAFALTILGGGRVAKYAQRFSETLNLGRRELAVLCTLMLRGPQTLGEIRDRSERIFSFADLEEAERTLDKMCDPGNPLVAKLPRQPGQKEARYAHLLSGEPEFVSEPDGISMAGPSRVASLEQEVRELQTEVADLKRRLEDLESQLR